MRITSQLNMDFVRRNSSARVWAVQGDCMSREVRISLFEDGSVWTVPEGVTASLRYIRSDGTGGSYDTLPDGTQGWRVEGSTVTMTLAPQLTAQAGLMQCHLVLTQGAKLVASFPFHLIVEEAQMASQEQPGDEPAGSFSVTWNLSNVSSSSEVASVSAGAALVAVLTPETGYTLGEVTVTMGGAGLSGVWDADTSTVTIASVTGDVVISCAGVERSEPQSETLSTMKWKVSGWPTFTDNGDGSFAMTINETLYDAPTSTNPYWTLLYPGEIAGGVVSITFHKAVTSGGISVIIYAGDQAARNFVDETKKDFLWNGGVSNSSVTTISADAQIEMPEGTYPMIWVRNSKLLMDGDEAASNAVTANHIVNGDITFTVTPQTVEGLSVDDDYAQNYSLSATALVTDGAESTTTGIDPQYAAVIEQAKNEWMLEANGNFNKIPLIIHTDQHGWLNHSVLFDYLAEILNWYDVGKVINLGDTVNAWLDDDTEHPLTASADLAEYLSVTEKVPFSRRIEVFGNHDTWKLENSAFVGLTPQNYLYKYFRNIYARRIDNYGNFVVRDDSYNVKYLVVSGFAYDSELGGYSHYVIPSDSIDWIIAELEKADGYDVVILSHVPLGSTETTVFNPIDETDEYRAVGGVNHTLLTQLWSGRKAKTSGSVTDEYGVTHSFDFTACDGELLCGLHGHMHEDGYYYIEGLLDVYFDAYYINPRAFFFVLIDRENRQLNVWKVDSTPQFRNYQIALDETII